MWLFLVLLAPFFIFLILEIKHARVKRIVNRIPGPKTLPMLGNAHQMGKNPTEILNTLFGFWNKYGKNNFRIWVGYFCNIFITNTEDLEYILTSNTLIKKSNVYDMIYPWLGEGLLTSYGDKWFKHRKMLTPSFHFKILQNFHDVMNTNSTKFIKKLHEVSKGESIFDFQDMAHYFTLDVICDTAMGVSINAMDNHDSDVVTAFKEMCYIVKVRAYHPIKRNKHLYKLTPEYSHFQKTLKTLQDFTNEVIRKRIELHKSSKVDTNNVDANDDVYSRRRLAFLDTLLTSTVDGRPLNKQELYEEVSTFMFEGHDTTTSGISFAIYILSRHPEIQRKVFAEQQQIMGANLKRDATFQEIADMKYLDLVIKEAQRLYPSVPFISRCADKDYNINGVIIPNGTAMNLFLMAMGYNEKVFPDPYRCDPDRFDLEKSGTKANPFEYVPFSAGPRNCIGQKFALLELKTVISKVVRTFEILPPLDELISQNGYVQHYLGMAKHEREENQLKCHKYDPILSAVLTLKSENGIQIRLRERN